MNYNTDPILPDHIEDEIPFPVVTGGVPQIVYGMHGQPLEFSPRNVVFSTSREYDSSVFERIDNLTSYLDNFDKINCMRTYAMGDVILCTPILKYLRRKYPTKELNLVTQPEFQSMFHHETEFGLMTGFRGQSVRCHGNEICVSLDYNTFECDHSTTHPFGRYHRTDIIFELFSVPPEERIYDYSINIPDITLDIVTHQLRGWGLETGNFIVMNWRGSNPIKTFPVHIREHIIREISKKIPILLVDWETRPDGYFQCDNVYWYLGQQTMNAITATGLAKAVLTTDSALLWWAHQTETPVACYLGPTLEEQRLVHHPLYPDNCKKIELKDLVGCPSACQHTLRWCRDNGHRVQCFDSVDKHRLVERTLEVLKSMDII